MWSYHKRRCGPPPKKKEKEKTMKSKGEGKTKAEQQIGLEARHA